MALAPGDEAALQARPERLWACMAFARMAVVVKTVLGSHFGL